MVCPRENYYDFFHQIHSFHHDMYGLFFERCRHPVDETTKISVTPGAARRQHQMQSTPLIIYMCLFTTRELPVS